MPVTAVVKYFREGGKKMYVYVTLGPKPDMLKVTLMEKLFVCESKYPTIWLWVEEICN